MRAVLLYNVYLINNWKKISEEVIITAPHESIVIHLSFDWRNTLSLISAYWYFRFNTRVDRIIVSTNHASVGESRGLQKMLRGTRLDKFDILTYIHSKGVTKPSNENVADWRRLMSHFVLKRFDLTKEAFEKGYKLFGVNLCKYSEDLGERKYAYALSDFWFRGTFVSVNLNLLRDELQTIPVDQTYYGTEGYWGKLCAFDEAYCPHNSDIDHYRNPYPKETYAG